MNLKSFESCYIFPKLRKKNQNKGKIRENDPVYNFDFTRKITFQKHAEIQNVGKKFVKYLNFQSDSSAFTSFL